MSTLDRRNTRQGEKENKLNEVRRACIPLSQISWDILLEGLPLPAGLCEDSTGEAVLVTTPSKKIVDDENKKATGKRNSRRHEKKMN